MCKKQLVFTVTKDCDGMTARTFLRKHCNVSARILTLLKREKDGILRDNKILRTVDTVNEGNKIVLNLPEDKNEIVPVKGELVILYEDEHLIAVDKPAYMPVHPTKVHQEDTLANILKYMQNKKGESYTFRAVNRLDKDTSGIVLIAKDKFTANAMNGIVKKTYIAVCEGIIVNSGTVDKPIKLLEGHTVQRTTAPDGKRAVTHYAPIKRDSKHTLLKLNLETGRTHQIRCHMSSIGHPLAGDDMYGGSLDYIERQALHCRKVEFIHPITEKRIIVKSKIPDDISQIIKEP
ncbi:MAG: RluA family pseudouridine synthase [Ruminococcus sp.]|nr:RluA family pseudouridine synthase [Ruminococcus sp.]